MPADIDKAGPQAGFMKRALIASLIFVSVVAAAGLLWLIASYLLIVFAAILLAILLDGIAKGIGRMLPISRPWRIGLALIVFFASIGAIGLMIPGIAAQTPQFASYLEQGVDWFRNNVLSLPSVQQSLENGGSGELMKLLPDPAGLIGGTAKLIGGTIGMLTGMVLILVLGIYLASQPSRYYQGALRLFNPQIRENLAETAEDIGQILRRWLVAQILMMLIVGVGSYIVLTSLGVPLALMLSFIAGLAAFIPYIGPVIGGGAMILVAAAQDLSLGLIVLGFYAGFQIVESYLLTPLIQSRAIFIPPALVIFAQVVFGVLFGILGVALATPLAAVIAVIVSRHYLNEPVKH
ncbi:MAG: AI-2E family transporter [Rhodomicrobium sp.]|nr:AI-2E family transporter [Rhodomicrobium sp.]